MSAAKFMWRAAALPLFLIILIVWTSSCAVSTYRQGVNQLKKDHIDEAISLLTQAEQEAPEDYRAKRELGIAFFKAKQYDDAVAKLHAAKAIKPDDSKTVFYLGLTHEARGDLNAAINEYKQYQNLSGGSFKKEISKRIRFLTEKKITAEIRQAISLEESLDVNAIPGNTVAVLYFRNLGESRELDPLQKGLAEMLITDLSKVRQITVVERIRLQKLLDELELSATGYVDASSAPRIGKLVQARRIINGGFTDLSEDELRIDASLAEVATTEISRVSEVTGALNTLFQMEKDLAFKIIDDLGIVLTREEREEIQKIPTESLLAFLAYSRGLDYEDRGMFEAARQEYNKAVELDPNFEQAKAAAQEVEVAESVAAAPPAEIAALEEEFSAETESRSSPARVTRLVNSSMAAQTGQTPEGDNDTHTLQESLGTDSALPPVVKVPVRVPLPD